MNLQKNCGILIALDALRELSNLITRVKILVHMVMSKPVLGDVALLVGQNIRVKSSVAVITIPEQTLDLVLVLNILQVP